MQTLPSDLFLPPLFDVDARRRVRATSRALHAALGPWTCRDVSAVARARLRTATSSESKSRSARCVVCGCGAPRVSFVHPHERLPYCEIHMDARILTLLDCYVTRSTL